jgi:hypothetical protein
MFKQIALAAAIAAASVACSCPVSAAVSYDYTAFNSFDSIAQLGVVGGAFTYIAPSFITSETPLPAASLSSCSFNAAASPATCLAVDFDPIVFLNQQVVGFFGGVSGLLGGANYLFDGTTFVTPGLHFTDQYNGVHDGALVVSGLPEPAIWTVIFLGLASLGVTIRRRHIAIQRLSQDLLKKEEHDERR